MKGLILKDIINMKSQLKIYVIIMALWFVLGMANDSIGFFSGVMVMFVVMIPITTLAYDEKVKWSSYALTMPVSRMDLILSKYLLMCVSLVVVAVFSLIGCLIISGDIDDSLAVTLSILPIGWILNAVLMPIVFKFGVEKGRFIFIGAAVAFSAIIVLAGKYGNAVNTGFFASMSTWVCVAALFAAAAIVTLISIYISARVYRNKDF